MTEKFCKDCKWLVVHSVYICQRPTPTSNAQRLVWGQTELPLNAACEEQRQQSASSFDLCGPSGKYWEGR